MSTNHPVVIVGAGPTGLAAAAHAHSRGLATVVLEAGPGAGSAVAQWGHVRLFSPWNELIDASAEELLATSGWNRPDADAYPTGAEWVYRYLVPLAGPSRHSTGRDQVRAPSGRHRPPRP